MDKKRVSFGVVGAGVPASHDRDARSPAGLGREDAQRISIMLSSPNLIGPFFGGLGPFWKVTPHPTGRARRG